MLGLFWPDVAKLVSCIAFSGAGARGQELACALPGFRAFAMLCRYCADSEAIERTGHLFQLRGSFSSAHPAHLKCLF